jgi:hypothetical protein
MQYRDVDILSSKTVGDSGTETVDLDVTDPITELAVVVGVTNDSSAVDGKIPTNIITKVELVDGGTVLASLTGPELAADFCYNAGRYPPHWYDEQATNGQSVTLPMRFGRFLGDPLRNFDPTRFRNPQIKVTWAKASGHASGSVTLGVRAKLLADVPGASSCLFTKAVRGFTSASSGVEETELPTDYPIRRLYVGAYLQDNVPASILTHFKLDCDGGKFIAFDMGSWAMCEEAERAFGYFHVRQFVKASNGDTKDCWLGNALYAALSAGDPGYISNAIASGNPFAYIWSYSHAGAAASAILFEMGAFGCLPHSVFAYPFGLPDDPSTWLNAGAYRSVKLLLTQGTASCPVSILVQQDRPI